MRALMTAAGAILLLSLAVSCGGDDDKAIDTGNGDVSVSLPDDFPDDFPVYGGADLEVAVEGQEEGIEGIVATWSTGDDFADVQAFYDDAFGDGPWQTTSEGTIADSAYWTVERGDDGKEGYILISEDDDVTIVAIVGEAAGELTDDASGDDGSRDSDSGTSADDLPEEVDLPAGYPGDRVPLPDGVRVTQAVTATADGATSYILQFYSEESVEDVADHFTSELEGNGFTQTITTSQNGGVFAVYAENEDGTGIAVTVTVTNSEVPGFTSTTMQVIDQ